MKLNLQEMPFSTRGSYMVVGYHEGTFNGQEIKKGIYLRTVHGMAQMPFIAQLIPVNGDEELSYTVEAQPHALEVKCGCGVITFSFADADTLVITGKGEMFGIRFEILHQGSFEMIEPVMTDRGLSYLVNSFGTKTRYMLTCQGGKENLDQKWNVSGAMHAAFQVDAVDRTFTVVLEEIEDSWYQKNTVYDIDQVCEYAKKEFDMFYQSMPVVPERFEEARRKAAYVNWSSIVKKKGFLKRDTMFMSKNWMCNVWTWDHCFNAMALAYENPQEAWNQFMLPFDNQTETGRLPDSINDSLIIDNYCKPPIHGWTLRHLKRIMHLDKDQEYEAYQGLSKWTEWWLNYRDQDHDGLCEYTHGNDSGWDNSTVFHELPPVTSPDLATFLIIQMEELANLADAIGRTEEMEQWNHRTEKMKQQLFSQLFDGEKPIAIRTITREKIDSESLLVYMPILLGMELPEDKKQYMIRQLKSKRFCTEHGLATESPQSPLYESDGYWRGPIWAPSTMLLADGLWECGEKEFVKSLTEKFCEMVLKSGCAENFDALTGDGLRDRAYTWTASVMLVMAHEFLAEETEGTKLI